MNAKKRRPAARSGCAASVQAVRVAAVVTATLAVGAGGGALPAGAQQCGSTVSECRTCHETRGERPVVAGPLPWHVDHAFADFCPRCHGGDPSATTAAAAHIGVSSPLDDVRGRCAPCHGGDSDALARRYRAFAAAQTAPPAGAAPSVPTPSVRGAVSWRNVALATAAVVLAVGGLAAITRHERRRRALSAAERSP